MINEMRYINEKKEWWQEECVDKKNKYHLAIYLKW